MFSYLHLPVFLWGLQCLTYYRSWKLLPLYTMLLLDSYVLSIFYKTNSHLLLCYSYLCEFPRLHPLIICCYLSYLFLWEENKLFSRVDYCLIDNSWAAHRKPQMCIFYMWTLVQTLIHLEAWKIALKGKCGHTTWGEKKQSGDRCEDWPFFCFSIAELKTSHKLNSSAHCCPGTGAWA